MLTLSKNLPSFSDAIFTRIKIFTLLYLSLEFTRMFISTWMAPHPYMSMITAFIFDAVLIILFILLYDDTHVGRDINTLNCFVVIVHLFYLPFYHNGIDGSMLHNYSVKALNVLIVLRLFYFGKKDLLAPIAVVDCAKRWCSRHHLFSNQYINRMTITISVLGALCIFTLIYLLNADNIRMSDIAVILFSFFVAIEKSKTSHTEKVTPHTIANEVPSTTAAPLEMQQQLKIAQEKIDDLKMVVTILAVALSMLLVIFSIELHARSREKFAFGYASGYADGKNGVPPQRETRLQKIAECFTDTGIMPPRDKSSCSAL